MTSVRLGEVDRFLVPVRDKRAVRFFLQHLFLPHSHREWIWSHVLRRSMWLAGGHSFFRECRKPDPRLPLAGELTDWLPDDLGRSVEAEEISWILLRDYPSSNRKKLLFFLFRGQEKEPFAVLKLGRGATRRALRAEWNALRYLHRRLPGELAATVPAPLGFVRQGGTEALLTSFVSGRTFDTEIARRPASEKTVTAQFESAASWLACFHITTRSDSVLDLDRPSVRLPLSASHGDFWSRNVLAQHRNRALGGPRLEVSGVVDWEHFSVEGPPYEDVFHFALTYALNYPWAPYRKKEPADAFRLAFVETTPISRAIYSGLTTYCDLTGLPFESLKPLFARYLESPSGARYRLPVHSERAAAFGETC